MSDDRPMKLWYVHDGDEWGWVAARTASSAAVVWSESVSDECDGMNINETPLEEVADRLIENEDGDPPQTMAEAFAECVKAGEPGYLGGSCR